MLAVYFPTGAYALIRLLLYILYICIPVFCPACRRLGRFGKPSVLLAQAETELATLPQLATEDMFITEHYFIVLANYGVAVIPIAEMVWIYKYSTLHKLLWYQTFLRACSPDFTQKIRASEKMRAGISGENCSGAVKRGCHKHDARRYLPVSFVKCGIYRRAFVLRRPRLRARKSVCRYEKLCVFSQKSN